MRFYRIEISDPKTGRVATPPGFSAGQLAGATYTSFANNQTLPGAWNVELDIPVINAATPQGGALVRIWGISLAEIRQSNDLVGKNISVFGGMQRGLPLANPRQSGLLASGIIFQAFGNWIETAMTLDLVILPGSASGSDTGGPGTLAAPKNIVLNWPAGQPFATAIKSCLQTAFPGYTVNVNISASIVRPNFEGGPYPTLEEFSQYCLQTSRDVIRTKDYPGVSIILSGKTIDVRDHPTEKTTAIAFTDLIGQPTWIESPKISIKTVMRADLAVWSKITLPQTLIENTQAAQSSLINQIVSFQGGFRIVSLRHVGDFRAPSADSWVTVIEAAPVQVAGRSG